ncbi:autotransporter secretion outer membrane protein TamA [Paraburkholderia caballeronis]|uniref:Autotransporter secretion outer membrane protein TamA n=2 Tax=Paraburkholderia caballeronis TaxID=416943 RepID=A0A1H7R9Y6_9BURK|nr:autotransporter secretion outer membrane protein TamA [Paraburkholderia caballeronis]PXW98925.1 autotransporter secretion outer membrane protein TamA [Paraburkholderia caballeronis]RAJ96131.1 autotransporter secretion outer membrane protein TamA [Paraburkholderia caballeronis]TDV14506.1 autotransporter secretion outer membrane protein TamA [Paraburkholderia caballeronis]TDV16032.1 autotransporter secretion outer membrane protein TamA [Paraburkholderia caballeronis]
MAGWKIESLRMRPGRAAGGTARGAVAPARVRWPGRPARRPHALRLAWPLVAALVAALWAGDALASYRVDIDASPRALRRLLQQHLDISRFAKRDDISDEQFGFLVTATPQQVRDLAATDGYFTPVVRTDVRTTGGKRQVRVSVEPGPQTKVSSVTLTFRGPVLTEDPTQENATRFAFSLREGDPFSQSGWDDAKNASLKALQSKRYLGAKIARSEARVDPQKHDAQLSVTFDSGPTFTMGALDVTGARRYPERIVHNVNPIAPGEIYDLQRVTELQRQLQNTPYYASVAIDVDNNTDQPLLTPLHAKLSEFPYNSFRGGVGYSTDTGAHVQGSYSYLNTFGAAWPFQIQGRLDEIQQFGQVQLSMPPGPRAWTNSALASYSSTDVSDTHIYSARIGVQRTRTSQNIDYAYQLLYYQDRLTQNTGAPTSSRALVPSWSWTRRNVDDPLFPRSGNLVRVEAGFAVKDVLADQTFIRGYMRGQQYFPIGRDDIVLIRAELGGVFTSGSSTGVPASLLFRAGGSNSVRGYGFQSIGNNVDGSILPTKYLVTSSAEYQHWFSHDWGAAAFFDVGTATDTWGEKQFFPGAGLGARWRSPVGPVNLDLAYGFRNRSVRPYLTLGIAF